MRFPKKQLKYLIKMVLPYGLFYLLKKIKNYMHIRRKNKFSFVLERNIVLKNKFINKRCFVVGNGSSLKQMDLKPLKNEYTYVVNEFIKHEDFYYIAPTFYSEIEPFNYLINLPKEHPYNIYTYYNRINEALKSLKTTLFFRVEFKEFIEDNNLFVNKNIFYLQSDDNILNNILIDDISKPNSFMDGVVYSGICNCVYMGFKDIYFIGCDCDWFRQKTEAHFYENPEGIPINESNEELLFHNYQTLRKWRIITTYFKDKGINIYNAGIGGDNDTCKRVNYNEVLTKK
jgi:hypothetical protein